MYVFVLVVSFIPRNRFFQRAYTLCISAVFNDNRNNTSFHERFCVWECFSVCSILQRSKIWRAWEQNLNKIGYFSSLNETVNNSIWMFCFGWALCNLRKIQMINKKNKRPVNVVDIHCLGIRFISSHFYFLSFFTSSDSMQLVKRRI